MRQVVYLGNFESDFVCPIMLSVDTHSLVIMPRAINYNTADSHITDGRHLGLVGNISLW